MDHDSDDTVFDGSPSDCDRIITGAATSSQPEEMQTEFDDEIIYQSPYFRSNLSLLNYWLFPTTDLQVLADDLIRFVNQEWDYSCCKQVEDFHVCLVNAATRIDTEEIAVPKEVYLSFAKLYADVREDNEMAYCKIIQSPIIKHLFEIFWSTGHRLSDVIYEIDIGYLELMRLHIDQSERNDFAFPVDVIRDLSRAVITVTDNLSADMSQFPVSFVQVRLPVLKNFGRSLVTSVYKGHLRHRDEEILTGRLDNWFTSFGSLARQSELSIEIDFANQELIDVMDRNAAMRAEKKKRDERKKVTRAAKKARRSKVPGSGAGTYQLSLPVEESGAEESGGEEMAVAAIGAGDGPEKRKSPDRLPYHCCKCPASFDSAGELDLHSKWHGSGCNYECSFCDYAVRNPAARNRHQKVHESPTESGPNTRSFMNAPVVMFGAR